MPSPYARQALPGEDAVDVAQRAAGALEAWLDGNHETTAAVILEPLVQCAAGMAMHDAEYLSPGQREEAVQLSIALKRMADQLRAGADVPGVEVEAMQYLTKRGWQPDYMTVRRRQDLQPPRAASDALVVLGAARLGGTRLIDNLEM